MYEHSAFKFDCCFNGSNVWLLNQVCLQGRLALHERRLTVLCWIFKGEAIYVSKLLFFSIAGKCFNSC